MMSWWKSTKSPSKSPTKDRGSIKGAAVAGASNETNLSPSASTKKASLSSVSRDPKTSDSRRGTLDFLQPTDKISALSVKDFVVILVEIFMVYCNQVIRRRKAEAHDYNSQLEKTRREIEVDLLFMQGWAVLGSLLAGVLADGYIGTFYVALSSIVFIFVMASCLYIEQMLIVRIRTNPYAEVMTEVASVAHFFNHSTGFSRVIFAIENMRNKKPSSISLLIFIFTLTGDVPTSGGILMLIANGTRMTTLGLVRLSWWVAGISVVLFLSCFKTITVDKSYRSASRKAVKCILDGFWHMCTDRYMKRDWRDYVHRKYDKPTLGRAKSLINYVILLLPISGFVFSIMGKFDNLFSRLWETVTPTGLEYYVGISAGLALTVLVSMLISYFVIIPVLTYIGYPKQFNYQFSLGYCFAVLSLYYAAFVMELNEVYDYDSEVGYIRIYNAKDSEVTVTPLETIGVNYTIPPHSAVMGTYVIQEDGTDMILVKVSVDKNISFTTFIMARAKKCIGYAITDIPDIIQISKGIPLFEGPPGTNDPNEARIYLFNGERSSLRKIVRFRDLTTGQWVLQLESSRGTTTIFPLPPGRYEVWVEETELHLFVNFKDGGLYGIMILTDAQQTLLEVDTVIDGKHVSSTVVEGVIILFGLALAYAYVSLRTMTYFKAPSGLVNMAFACLSVQENLTAWVLVVGYYTWHELIWGSTLLTYSFTLTFLFFVSVFVMMKYNYFFS